MSLLPAVIVRWWCGVIEKRDALIMAAKIYGNSRANETEIAVTVRPAVC